MHSPELYPNGTTDHTLCVIDPLESAPSLQGDTTQSLDTGVLVAMGLLSAILVEEPEEPQMVTGSFKKDARGITSLEIIMSFKQVFFFGSDHATTC